LHLPQIRPAAGFYGELGKELHYVADLHSEGDSERDGAAVGAEVVARYFDVPRDGALGFRVRYHAGSQGFGSLTP
jgi:hypothetical protein